MVLLGAGAERVVEGLGNQRVQRLKNCVSDRTEDELSRIQGDHRCDLRQITAAELTDESGGAESSEASTLQHAFQCS